MEGACGYSEVRKIGFVWWEKSTEREIDIFAARIREIRYANYFIVLLLIGLAMDVGCRNYLEIADRRFPCYHSRKW